MLRISYLSSNIGLCEAEGTGPADNEDSVKVRGNMEKGKEASVCRQ